MPVPACPFENLVNKYLYEYLDKNELFYGKKIRVSIISFGLHVLVMCFISTTYNWYFHFDQEMCSSIVFVDLKKASDTVDHDILLGKTNSQFVMC